MGLNRRDIKAAMAAGALAIVLAGPTTALAQSVLRLVPQADLKILDTVQTTNNITSNHGYMIYDTLFSLDSKLMPKPQMVESYTKSADGLNWTFKLRAGQKFHDGQPVTAKDVVASMVHEMSPRAPKPMGLTPNFSPAFKTAFQKSTARSGWTNNSKASFSPV